MLAPDGTRIARWSAQGTHVAVAPDGSVLAAAWGRRYDASGTLLTRWTTATGPPGIYGLTIDPAGALLVMDNEAMARGLMRRYSYDGQPAGVGDRRRETRTTWLVDSGGPVVEGFRADGRQVARLGHDCAGQPSCTAGIGAFGAGPDLAAVGHGLLVASPEADRVTRITRRGHVHFACSKLLPGEPLTEVAVRGDTGPAGRPAPRVPGPAHEERGAALPPAHAPPHARAAAPRPRPRAPAERCVTERRQSHHRSVRFRRAGVHSPALPPACGHPRAVELYAIDDDDDHADVAFLRVRSRASAGARGSGASRRSPRGRGRAPARPAGR